MYTDAKSSVRLVVPPTPLPQQHFMFPDTKPKLPDSQQFDNEEDTQYVGFSLNTPEQNKLPDNRHLMAAARDANNIFNAQVLSLMTSISTDLKSLVENHACCLEKKESVGI